MAVRIIPGFKEQLMKHVFVEMSAIEERKVTGVSMYSSDICDWAERNFYIPLTAAPIVLPLHQKAIFRYFFTRRDDKHFPFQNIVYSAVKKSGKSTSAGVIARWFAETQTRYGEIYAIGNDLEQAKDRSYKEVVRSLELTPGYNHGSFKLPGRWTVAKMSMRCLLTGSVIKAIAVDAAGEAGGQQSLSVWTELWGAENAEAKRFWEEMTPIPTVPDSVRLVETYAGYEGESQLLRGLFDVGMAGRQLTAGELAAFVCRPGVEGEEFQDYVDCWHETRGDPDVLIPVWVNESASLGMYWDSGMAARRMPWQHMFVVPETGEADICDMCLRSRVEHEIGGTSEEYYSAQEAILPPQAYRRLHLNEWVGAESQFVPMESWDRCDTHFIPMLMPGEMSQLVGGVDAAVTGDCFGIVVGNRCPLDSTCVDVRAIKKWEPSESGGTINLDLPTQFLRLAAASNNIVQYAYDPYQMEATAQTLRREGVAWMEPFSQAGDRLRADSGLYDLIIGRRIHYHHTDGCPKGEQCNCWVQPLRQHIANANAKVQKDEDSKIRIVKKASGNKIDLAVSLSMMAHRCLYLSLEGGLYNPNEHQ